MLYSDYITIIYRILKLLTIIFYESNIFFCYKFLHYIYNKKKFEKIEFLKRLTYKLEKENIVYVKVFQALCVDKDILNNDEKDYLIKYTDSVPYNCSEIDYNLLNKLQDEFNITLNSSEPINSGIVGMVFNGYDSSQNKIVIKMLKKNILKKFENVFDELLFISYLLTYIPYINSLKITKLLMDNKDLLLNQMDFIKEMTALQTFRIKYKNNKELIIPKVYSNITEKYNNLLIMENIEGLKFKDIENMDFSIKEEFAYIINKFGITGILHHSAIHCDLHIGNLFFYINDNSNNTMIDLPKYQVGIIDFGISCFPDKTNQYAYYLYFNEVQNNKNYSKLEFILETIIEEKENFINSDKDKKLNLINEIKETLEKNISDEIGPEVSIKISKIFNKYNFNFSEEFNKLILSLHTVNGVAKQLSHNVKNSQKNVLNDLNKINDLLKI